MKKKMYMYIGAITIVIAGLLITSTTCMGKQNTTPNVFSNQPPVAVDDSQIVYKNSVNNIIYVLANDLDPEGDPLTITSVTQPSHGVVTIEGDHILYTPTTGYPSYLLFSAPDSFTYTINDGFPMPSHFVTATVQISIHTCMPAPPPVLNPHSDHYQYPEPDDSGHDDAEPDDGGNLGSTAPDGDSYGPVFP
ncbi:MAG: Ig-like domain-containing protein [Euryarchaeota archaeon]|nr:Ig-like domain-containing protein [Euryarchaeota archaeon]